MRHFERSSAAVEKRKLAWVAATPDALVTADVDVIGKSRIGGSKPIERLGPAGGEPHALPHLVDTARIAGVTGPNYFSRCLQPARKPELDGVGLGQDACPFARGVRVILPIREYICPGGIFAQLRHRRLVPRYSCDTYLDGRVFPCCSHLNGAN